MTGSWLSRKAGAGRGLPEAGVDSIRDPGSSNGSLASCDNLGYEKVMASLSSRPRVLRDGLRDNLECSLCVRNFGHQSAGKLETRYRKETSGIGGGTSEDREPGVAVFLP